MTPNYLPFMNDYCLNHLFYECFSENAFVEVKLFFMKVHFGMFGPKQIRMFLTFLIFMFSQFYWTFICLLTWYFQRHYFTLNIYFVKTKIINLGIYYVCLAYLANKHTFNVFVCYFMFFIMEKLVMKCLLSSQTNTSLLILRNGQRRLVVLKNNDTLA